jgi:uncharacterized metal-binding protein YceD (DUF177 family)
MSKPPRAEPIPPPEHGFRRMIAIAKVGEGGLVQKITVGPSDLPRIAAYLDLAAIEGLSAEITLTRWRARGVRVNGKIKADVVQTCVVTLDPVPAHIDAEFERRFLPVDVLPKNYAEQQEVFIDPEGEDPPEPVEREIDLGEVLIEELALTLDPYPRKAGVEFHADEAPEGKPRKNPFAVLAKLKPKQP